jgi:hypothetical protein
VRKHARSFPFAPERRTSTVASARVTRVDKEGRPRRRSLQVVRAVALVMDPRARLHFLWRPPSRPHPLLTPSPGRAGGNSVRRACARRGITSASSCRWRLAHGSVSRPARTGHHPARTINGQTSRACRFAPGSQTARGGIRRASRRSTRVAGVRQHSPRRTITSACSRCVPARNERCSRFASR